MKKILAFCAVLALCACATSEGSVEVAFQTARVSANAYESLPLCPGANPCADKAIVQKIHDASETAYNTLIVARKTQSGDAISAANQAVTTLTSVINLPEVQAALNKTK